MDAPGPSSIPQAPATVPSAPTGGDGTGRPEPAPAPATTERRLVSVLFADLVGFTTLSEARDAEEVRELLGRYFDTCRAIIARYGGTVEKFIGDAVMAVWGTPTAFEDDAERAVRAALELVDAVARLGTGLTEHGLQLRAGVLTGEAAVTIGADNQGMVVGDLVNTASRLQSVAPAGTVLVGEATHRAARDAIAFEALGDQQLKGKALPIPAWRALRVVAQRRGVGRSEQVEAPFVGRDDELRLLKDLYHATAREGRARLVSVIGQAGIGKSRLAWEFLKYIDGLVETAYWHEGRSPAYGEGITFWALGEMVRRRAGIAEADDARTSKEKLASSLAEHVPDEQERRWVEPRLLQLLGLEPAPPGEREELFAAWRTFFERIAQSGQVVLVFEDLQWADGGLLDFIESVLEWSRTHPILIVTLARPDLLERRPAWGASQRSFTGLHLEPLPDAAMSALLAGMAPGLPGPLVRQIVARAEGIPLYAVETVRMLVDTGRLVRDEGGVYRWTGEGRLGQLDVPESLQALIAARLEGVSPPDRSLLQDAAVLGQSFTIESLADLSGEPAEQLQPRLTDIVRKEILVLNHDPRSPERGQYAFVQGLIRDVVHGTIARRERRARHLAAARYFERLGGEELAGVLASHYLEAFRANPEGPEAEAVAIQARIALKAAADRAMGLHAPDQALAYLEQALSITVDLAERASLRDEAARAALAAVRFDVAEPYLRESIAFHESVGDRLATGRATGRLGEVLIQSSRIEEAIPMLEAAVASFPSLDADPEAVALAHHLARGLLLHGEPAKGLEWVDRGLEAAARLDLVMLICELMNNRGWALVGLGRHREGIAVGNAAAELASELGFAEAELRARNNVASALSFYDPRAALEGLDRAMELARRAGSQGWILKLGGFAAALRVMVGDWDRALLEIADLRQEGIPLLSRTAIELTPTLVSFLRGEPESEWLPALREFEPLVEASTALPDRHYLEWIRSWRAFVQGEFPEALAAAARNAASWREAGTPDAPYHLARMALWARDEARVRGALDDLRSIPEKVPWLTAATFFGEASLAALAGDRTRAAQGFEDAMGVWRELGYIWELVVTGLAFVTFVGAEVPEAAAAGEEARVIAIRLGARPIVERLDAALVVARTEPDGVRA